MEEKEIRRGDIYHANLNPVKGSEQGGYRPVLVIQNNRGNEYSPTVIVAAITSRPKHRLSTHVPLTGIEGLMGLGPICAKPFSESREHFIHRADRNQKLKETCMFCNVRQGCDYFVRKKYNSSIK